MKKYKISKLQPMNKVKLFDLCVSEGISAENMTNSEMRDALLQIEAEEVPSEAISDAYTPETVDCTTESVQEENKPISEPISEDRGFDINYARELARRMGNRVADTYQQELLRRKGVGSMHLSAEDAIAAEIAKRRKLNNR